MSWTPEQYEAYQRRSAYSEARASRLSAGGSGPVAKLECATINDPLAKASVQEIPTGRILVSVKSVRKRLLDEDNLSCKGHVDLCRYAGIIPCDSPDKVKIEVCQEKAVNGQEEYVEITITQL